MLNERVDNALAALDILARADSVAFAAGRADRSYDEPGFNFGYMAVFGGKRQHGTVFAMSEAGAVKEVQRQGGTDVKITSKMRSDAARNDAAPSGCTFILVDGAVDQVIQHTGAWQSIVAREVRDLKKMDCGKVTTKEYANETIGYTKHDSVRSDATSGDYTLAHGEIKNWQGKTAPLTLEKKGNVFRVRTGNEVLLEDHSEAVATRWFKLKNVTGK